MADKRARTLIVVADGEIWPTILCHEERPRQKDAERAFENRIANLRHWRCRADADRKRRDGAILPVLRAAATTAAAAAGPAASAASTVTAGPADASAGQEAGTAARPEGPATGTERGAGDRRSPVWRSPHRVFDRNPQHLRGRGPRQR